MSEPATSPPSLCRKGSQTCGACCWGVDVDRETLSRRLERNRVSFEKIATSGILSISKLFWHEIRTTRGMNLIWAVLLHVPRLNGRLKQHLAKHLICPFIGFDSAEQRQVGCMVHPSRREGFDNRNAIAFRLLRGIECGDPNYVCNGCHTFDALNQEQRAAFVEATDDFDWFDYTTTVRAFSCGLAGTIAAHRPGVAPSPEELLPILSAESNKGCSTSLNRRQG